MGLRRGRPDDKDNIPAGFESRPAHYRPEAAPRQIPYNRVPHPFADAVTVPGKISLVFRGAEHKQPRRPCGFLTVNPVKIF